MNKLNTVEMDTLCEIASAIVERQYHKEHQWTRDHSYTADNGDVHYIDEVQDEFNAVLDIVDEILNPEVY